MVMMRKGISVREDASGAHIRGTSQGGLRTAHPVPISDFIYTLLGLLGTQLSTMPQFFSVVLSWSCLRQAPQVTLVTVIS